jgi:prefoldin alpha subunit
MDNVASGIEERAGMLDARLRGLRENLERMAQLVMEFEIAKSGITELKAGKADTLVNVGGGILAMAQMETKHVLAPMGGGYYASLLPDEAMGKIEKLITSARKNQEIINEEVKRIEKDLVGLLKEARGQHSHV